MKILITGASGMVGTALCSRLRYANHDVRTLSRGSEGDFRWDVEKEELAVEAVEGLDAVIHLAGESVAQRWTEGTRRRIRESRVLGSRLLVQRLRDIGQAPVFISASGINYYGYKKDDSVDESSPLGQGFLAEVCRDWEDELKPMVDLGSRCVFVRTGVVLSKSGGALRKMLPAFRAGLGGPIGSGRQMMSWITLEDMVQVLEMCLSVESIYGPVNAVSPEPVSNKDFAKFLGRAINRPAIMPLPSSLALAIFGSMARETILSDLAVNPSRLIESGFEWTSPNLQTAFERIFKP